MKQIFSILLVMTLLTSMIPSAMAEENDIESLKQHIQELEAEIAEKDAIIAEIKASGAKQSTVVIENVSVDFAEQLPASVKSNSTYSHYGSKEKLDLSEDQIFAIIEFTIINQGKTEVKVSDIHDDFYIEMNYNSGFLFSTDSEGPCILQSGNNIAIMSPNSSIGKVVVAPLSTAEVTLYLPCAKVIADAESDSLSVSFKCTHTEIENYTFSIR